MIRVVINGILGRMGRGITRAILADEDLFLAGGIDTLETFHAEEIVVTTNPDEVLEDADLLVDFSSSIGTKTVAEACANHNVMLITGTTSLDPEAQSAVSELAKKVAVVQDSSFSIGLNFLMKIVESAAAAMEGNFDTEIVELHSRQQQSAPGPNAQRLAQAVAEATGAEKDVIVSGRKGDNLVRANEIAVHSLRGGAVVGEHHVHLLRQNEHITLSHKTISRKSYVDGVIRAAHWVIDKSPGLYSMRDII